MKDRKGTMGDQVLVVLFLANVILIGAGIVLGVTIFYGGDLDYRRIHSEVLYSKVRECIANENINWEQVKLNKEYFYDKCKIRRDVLPESFFRVCKGVEDCDEEKALFSTGGDLVACYLTGGLDNRNYPVCTNGTVQSNGESLYIISGSNLGTRRKLYG